MRLLIEVEGEEVVEIIEEFRSFRSKLDRLDIDVRCLATINDDLFELKKQIKELVDANKKV